MNKEFYILRYERTEYAKRIRKDYESKRIKERRCNMRKWGIRHDGLCNTLSTVQKDNYLLEVNYKDDRDMSELQSKITNLLIEKHLVKPYEAIDVTFANSRLNEIEQNIPLKSKNKTDPSIAPTITTNISNLGFCVPTVENQKGGQRYEQRTFCCSKQREES